MSEGEKNDLGFFVQQLAEHRRQGQTTVLTYGDFELLHPGNLAWLWQASELGDCLIVAVRSDDTVREHHGEGRPVVDVGERIELLSALRFVDYAFSFDGEVPLQELSELHPELVALPATRMEDGEGAAVSAAIGEWGGELVELPGMGELTTAAVMARVSEPSQG